MQDAGVRIKQLLGMVGQVWSAIVPDIIFRAEELGQRCGGVKDKSALAPA